MIKTFNPNRWLQVYLGCCHFKSHGSNILIHICFHSKSRNGQPDHILMWAIEQSLPEICIQVLSLCVFCFYLCFSHLRREQDWDKSKIKSVLFLMHCWCSSLTSIFQSFHFSTRVKEITGNCLHWCQLTLLP